MTIIIKHGGKRTGAGRKPVEDKKIEIRVYIEQSRVNVLGKENIVSICSDAVSEAFENKLKKLEKNLK